jgi:hypothetical protein
MFSLLRTKISVEYANHIHHPGHKTAAGMNGRLHHINSDSRVCSSVGFTGAFLLVLFRLGELEWVMNVSSSSCFCCRRLGLCLPGV